jgi:hypothetical protein
VGVGNTFRGNHVHDVPHYAIMGGANQATCTSETGWGQPPYVPDDEGICGCEKKNTDVFATPFFLRDENRFFAKTGSGQTYKVRVGLKHVAAAFSAADENVFEGNVIEDAVYECDDSGTCSGDH